MANQEHLAILKQGVEVWNEWRGENPDVWADLSEADLIRADLSGADLERTDLRQADLSGADLSKAYFFEADLREANISEAKLRGAYLSSAYLIGTNLRQADLSGADLINARLRKANLEGADLSGADLWRANLIEANLCIADLTKADLREADFTKADLRRADLIEANLNQANLSQADLYRADLRRANLWEANLNQANLSEADLTKAYLERANLSKTNLRQADLSGADLSWANLEGATLIDTDMKKADLTGCSIYGISAWDLNLKDTIQENLIISPSEESIITVDNLQVAQFIYLLLNNEEIRDVIDTITSKVVLILGRFTPKRKTILDAIRNELRKHNYLPILFDFEKPTSRDFTETISTLAHLARFIIADITDAKSIPQELQRIVPDLPSVPVQPLIASSDYEYALFEHFRNYPWVLDEYQYDSQDDLLTALEEKVIAPAETKAKNIATSRQTAIEAESRKSN